MAPSTRAKSSLRVTAQRALPIPFVAFRDPAGLLGLGQLVVGQDILASRSILVKQSARFLIPFGVLLTAVPTAVNAHFRLLEPASWLIEDTRGDPQKAGPCGGTNADWGKPSFVIGKATGGGKL